MVEHVIAGVKRCRIVKEVLRLTTEGISDVVMEIACGLHNLRVSYRHPLLVLDLLSWVNGFDHGVGHSLLLLYDAKTSHGENIINFNGLSYDPSAGLYKFILDHNKIYH